MSGIVENVHFRTVSANRMEMTVTAVRSESAAFDDLTVPVFERSGGKFREAGRKPAGYAGGSDQPRDHASDTTSLLSIIRRATRSPRSFQTALRHSSALLHAQRTASNWKASAFSCSAVDTDGP